MHKAVILLVEAENRENAISRINDFMEPYGDGKVWDWWKIGGRWMNQLAPMDKLAEYNKQMKELLGLKETDLGFSMKSLEKNRDKLQEIWENLGLKGKQPYYYDSGFSFSMPKDGGYYDVIPLSEAIEKVKDWAITDDKAEEMFNKMLEQKEIEKKIGKPDTMSAYYAARYAELKYQDFSFECNVFNTEENNFSIPEELNGWYAVMIDMHN